MNNIWKRSLAMLLTVVMVFGLLPVQAFALEDTTVVVTETPTETTTPPETTAPPETTVPPTTAVTEAPHVCEFTEVTASTAATCTTVGSETKACSCGKTTTVEFPVIDHTYVDGKCECGAQDPDYVAPSEATTAPTDPVETTAPPETTVATEAAKVCKEGCWMEEGHDGECEVVCSKDQRCVLVDGHDGLCEAFGGVLLTDNITTEAALSAALAAGGEVVLGGDILVNTMIEIPAGVTVTLDLAGYDITSGLQTDTTKHIYPIRVNGELTIKDSTATGSGDSYTSGSITGRGIYVGTENADNDNVKLTVENGAIYGIDSNGGSALFQYGGEIVINDGLVEQTADYTYNYAIYAGGGKITINGGKVVGKHGALSVSGAEATVTGGELICTGNEGWTDNVVYVSAGSINVTGGTITHKGAAVNADSGAALVAANDNVTMTISGGSFTGLNGAVSGNAKTTITGGTFVSGDYSTNHYDDVSDYVPEGYEFDAETGKVAEAAPAVSGTFNGGHMDLSDPNEIFITTEIANLSATESVVVKIYSGETLIATTTLQKSEYFVMDSLSVKTCLTGSSSSWTTVWEAGMPSADLAPTSGTLYVDGTKMNSAAIQMCDNAESPVVWAELDGVNPAPAAGPVEIDLSQGSYTITEAGEYTVKGCITTNTLTINAEGGVTVTLNGVTINALADNSAISIVKGNVTLISTGDSNTLTGGDNGAGIYVAAAASLTIKGDEMLNATGNNGADDASGAAGIGGTYANGASGKITIDGAKVTAVGYGEWAAGIGSAGGYADDITIKGGADVYAVGGYYANGDGAVIGANYGKNDPEGGAAIGGGSKDSADVGTITITGSTVEAYGGSKAAGIGAMFWNDVEAINITNSTVTAYGGSSSAAIGTSRIDKTAGGSAAAITISGGNITAVGGDYGAAIGMGYNADSVGKDADSPALAETTISISGATVNATGGMGSAAIGGGYKSNNVDIDITGGTITATAGELVSGKTVENGGAPAAIGSGANGSGTFAEGPAVAVDTTANVTVTAYEDGKPAIEGMTNEEVKEMTNVTLTEISAPPKGTVTPAYTDANSFWGEGTSNSKKSFVVELYEGETKIASASLNNVNGIIDGDVYVTWHINFGENNDEYWTVEWAEGYPNINMAPTKVVLVADDKVVAENNAQWNGPDNLNKIVALAEGNTGGLKAYTTLSEAMGKFNGRKVNVLCDVTESIEGFYGATLTTNVEGGVTIDNTNTEGWVSFTDVNIGTGVTVKTAYVHFNGRGIDTITGTLIATEGYYHQGESKLTIKDGGKLVVEGAAHLRYNKNADAGIYVYGDGNDETVELDVAYYLGAYSGTVYAKNANIEAGYVLLKNSNDSSSYADAAMTLDNSSLTVVGTTDGQDSFIIDDQASLTLTNGASIKDVREFNILTGTNLTLSVDETSSISATNVSIAEDVPFEAVENGDGTYGIKAVSYVAQIGDTKYTDLKEALTAAQAGETVVLLADIDLAGTEWEPVEFKGSFDGQNHTISNLVVNKPGVTNVGFFSKTSGAEIKNLTIHNAKVTGRLNVGVVAGHPWTTDYTNIKVTGHVEVNGMSYVGGVGGKNAYGDWTDITVDVDATSYVKADSVENGTAYRTYVGGVIGFNGEGSQTYKNISSNIKVIGSTRDIGGLFGIAHYGNNFENVTFTGSVEAPESAKEVGGIAGVWHNQLGQTVTFTNVTSTGTVTVGTETTTGSIVGGAYNAANVTPSTSGSLIIDGEEAWLAVAKIGETKYQTLAAALAAAKNDETVELLWAEGDAPIDMQGYVSGKTVTITGTAAVDWEKGFLFVGRTNDGTAAADATLIFSNANLTTTQGGDHGIHVSGAEKGSATKANGTVEFTNSAVNLSYLINKGDMTLNNSTLTVKSGFSIGGRPASETESGEDATATITLNNNSKVVVNNHNGMGLGYEAIGVMNVDATSTFETTQSFLITEKGTLNLAGKATIAGTLTNNGSIVLTNADATLTSSECDNVTTNVADYKVAYEEGSYKLVAIEYVAQTMNSEGNVIGKFETFEAAVAAACADATITRIEILSDYVQTAVQNTTAYNDITGNLTIGAPEGMNYTVTVDVTGDSIALCVKNGGSLTIEENVTIEGLDVVANGFATTGDNMTINGTLKALSLKQWTRNGTITVSQTGKVQLGYGDGQFDMAYGNGTVTITGNGDKTTAQFKAGYSGTRGNGNTLNLKDTYFEAGAWFNLNGSNGTINADNALLKVSGGDASGKLTITSTGNTINLTNGSELVVATLTIGADNTIKLDKSSKITATTITGAGSIVIDATNMAEGDVVGVTGDLSDFTGTYEVVNGDGLEAVFNEDGQLVLQTKKLIEVTYADGTVEKFATMAEAVPETTNYDKLEGATIKLLGNVAGNGIRFMENNMVLDLNGFTYTINNATGSSGTKTSGFQIREDAKNATIKNGTIAVAEFLDMGDNCDVVWMFNSYSENFVVENVTVDCANMAFNYDGNTYICVSHASNDKITFTGNTKFVNFNTEEGGNALNTAGSMVIADSVDVTGLTVELDKGATLTAKAGLNVVTADGYMVVYANGVYSSVQAVAQIDEIKYATLDAAFTAAQSGDEVKILAAGTYALSTSGKDITITGAVNGVIFNNIGAKNMGGANVTFNNVTFQYAPASTYMGLQHSGNLVYNNCTFMGQVFLYGTSETFNNCTFVQTDANNYNVWTYGAKKVAFNNCAFNSNGKSVLVYNEGACATELTVTGTTFNATTPVAGKAAIEIDTSLMPAGTTITIDAATTATGFDAGSVSGSSLWNDKKDQTNLAVYVGGEKVWPVAKATIVHGLQTIISGTEGADDYREAITFSLEDVYAENSLEIKIYAGETLLGTTTWGKDYPVKSSELTVNNVISGDDSSSWNTTWEEGALTFENVPTKIEVYTDGTLADTYEKAEGAFLYAEDKTEYQALFAVASITVDGTTTYYGTLADAIAAVGEGDVVIELLKDATLDYNAREAYGTAETTSLTITGNGNTLTLNQKDSDWSSIGLANADAKLVLNNMTIEKTGYGDTSGAWNTHAINFTSNVEMNNVTVNQSMSVQDGATLNNVTINEANGYYGLWIKGNGQTVTVNGGAINATNGGRGIKIADEYVGEDVAQVTLNVTGTDFNTAKKAAVLVSSTAGAEVTASNVDITNVTEDTVNFVWVDEDWAAYYNSVKVSGCTKTQENEASFPIKVWYVNDAGVKSSVRAYYKTLDELFAAPATQVPGSNYIELRGNVAAESQVNVSYGSNRVYTFGTEVEGGVTMDFKYADNWNMLPKFDLGENITMNVPYLQVIGGDIEIAGILNTNYLYLYGTGEGVTITETGVVNANTGDATVQVKGGTVLTVNGKLNTSTLNVWTQDTNNSELIVSGESAQVTASHLHGWNGKDGVSAQKIVVENGATLTATNLQADRGTEVTVDAATLAAETLTLGYEGNIGTLTVTNNGVITNGAVLNSVNSTVIGPEDMNVTSGVDGYMVVYEDGVYKLAQMAAKIGEQGYTTLQEAVNAAKDGDTITLMKNGEIALVQKNVTITKNGYEATVAALNGYTTLVTETAYSVVKTSELSEDKGEALAYVDADNDGEHTNEELMTLQDALDAAEEGGYTYVRMTGNITAGTVIIPAGVILDIQANTLTADRVIGLSGSYLTATTTKVGSVGGLLIAAKDSVVLSEGCCIASNYGVLPIWNGTEERYEFGALRVTDDLAGHGLTVSDEEIKFVFRHQAGSYYKQNLLNDGGIDNGVKVIVTMTWEANNALAEQTFVYNDSFFKEVNTASNQDYVFYLKGYEQVGVDLTKEATITASIVTDCGMSYSLDPITVSK